MMMLEPKYCILGETSIDIDALRVVSAGVKQRVVRSEEFRDHHHRYCWNTSYPIRFMSCGMAKSCVPAPRNSQSNWKISTIGLREEVAETSKIKTVESTVMISLNEIQRNHDKGNFHYQTDYEFDAGLN